MARKTDFQEHLRQANPFMIRGKDDRLVWFEDAKEAYQMLLQDLRSQFPAGFVDVPLFMLARQGVMPNAYIQICPEKQYAYIHWWDLQNPDVQFKLKYVLRLLLVPSGLPLDDELFEVAITTLDDLLEKQDVKDTLRQNQNLHVIQAV